MSERRGSRRGASNPAGDLAREALRRASAHEEPEIGRLIEAVPAMLAEAERRRRVASMPAARIYSMAGLWLPRLAAATALLLAVALLWPGGSGSTRDRSATADSSASLDAWLVTGKAPSSVPDPVLDVLVR